MMNAGEVQQSRAAVQREEVGSLKNCHRCCMHETSRARNITRSASRVAVSRRDVSRNMRALEKPASALSCVSPASLPSAFYAIREEIHRILLIRAMLFSGGRDSTSCFVPSVSGSSAICELSFFGLCFTQQRLCSRIRFFVSHFECLAFSKVSLRF